MPVKCYWRILLSRLYVIIKIGPKVKDTLPASSNEIDTILDDNIKAHLQINPLYISTEWIICNWLTSLRWNLYIYFILEIYQERKSEARVNKGQKLNGSTHKCTKYKYCAYFLVHCGWLPKYKANDTKQSTIMNIWYTI